MADFLEFLERLHPSSRLTAAVRTKRSEIRPLLPGSRNVTASGDLIGGFCISGNERECPQRSASVPLRKGCSFETSPGSQTQIYQKLDVTRTLCSPPAISHRREGRPRYQARPFLRVVRL